jgi:hypothetical protein
VGKEIELKRAITVTGGTSSKLNLKVAQICNTAAEGMWVNGQGQ